MLLHGCSGLTSTNHWWADTLRSWGYVALLVDNLGPRGETVVCDTFRVDPLYARMPDAYAARSYLAGQPFVAAARIGLIGWSHGGITTLHAVDDVYLSRLGSDRFRAAIAFYPGCLIRLLRLNAPLLILIGEEDDWTPAARCRRMEVEPETSHEFTLKIYPGAYHETWSPAASAARSGPCATTPSPPRPRASLQFWPDIAGMVSRDLVHPVFGALRVLSMRGTGRFNRGALATALAREVEAVQPSRSSRCSGRATCRG